MLIRRVSPRAVTAAPGSPPGEFVEGKSAQWKPSLEEPIHPPRFPVPKNRSTPFAETTFMTAASTGTDPIEHAKTQFLYAIPVIIGTLVSFIVAGLVVDRGLWHCFLISGGAGIITTIGLLVGFAYGKKASD